MGLITVLWVSAAPPLSPPAGAKVVAVPQGGLGPSISSAAHRGAVVVVVDTDEAAHRALASGADEVARAETLDAPGLELVVERARLRAAVRSLPARGPEDLAAIELLAASISSELQGRLAAASFSCDVLRAAMGPVAGLADSFARSAMETEPMPSNERARVVALRASAPPTVALRETVDGLTVALRDAARVVSQACSFMVDAESDDPIDLVDAVRDLVSLVGVVVERDANLHVELPEARCFVAFPRAHLAQTVAALISNALHATAERGVRGRVVIRVVPTPDAALLEIVDDGIGMLREMQDRVFEPAFTTRPPAAGLGLTIAADRVRSAGGDILLESEVGVGTKVQIFLPLVAPGLARATTGAN